jgi:hypothetical protein
MVFIPKFRFKKRYIIFFGLLYHNVSSLYDDALFSKETIAFWSLKTVFSRILFDGHNLHYIETGNAQKPTLIFFVHGSPSWNVFKEYLQDTTLLKKLYDCY